jgi:ABC-type multidrug transport system fused ATPase/permease subunit
LKRLEAISKSPIYSLFSETLHGASVIRAFGHQARFFEEAFVRTDNLHRPFYFLWATNRWLGVRTDLASSFIILGCGIGIAFSGDLLDASIAGFALSFAVNVTDSLMWAVRAHAMVEIDMNSAERVQEYLLIPQEPSHIVEGNRPPSNWPAKGHVHVQSLTVQYSIDQNPVLKDISFILQPGEKVAVVGRTGAGKSTLMLAFYRFVEAFCGSITIDGINIHDIGLEDLRSRLVIIPQDPLLFTGTVRSNLDPDDIHSDAALYHVLQRVHLTGSAAGTKAIHLDMPVLDNGSNFSVGQKGLLCLARGLLKQSRVILIDEATASIDTHTDSLIQETIRDVFSDSTVLCIAHRLTTIADYDRVLVLDAGEIVEFDTPYNLLEGDNARGLFRKMCEESGDFDVLLTIAQQKQMRHC